MTQRLRDRRGKESQWAESGGLTAQFMYDPRPPGTAFSRVEKRQACCEI